MYVDDYTGFSGDTDLQKGNYLAIHCEVTNVDGAVIKCKLDNEVTLDSDGICVIRIRDKSTQTLRVVATKDGYATKTLTYSLSGLTVNES